MKASGVLHDAVVHCKKLKKNKAGKKTWQNARCVRVTDRTLSDGKKLSVKAGAQHVDRAWRLLKDRLKKNQNLGFEVRICGPRPGNWSSRSDKSISETVQSDLVPVP